MGQGTLHLRAHRWLAVAVYGVAAASIVLLLGPWTSVFCETLANGLARLTISVGIPAVITVAMGVLCVSGRGRWAGLIGVRHFTRYPPLWVAVLIGLILLAGVMRYIGEPGLDSWLVDAAWAAGAMEWWSWAWIATAACFPAVLARLDGLGERQRTSRKDRAAGIGQQDHALSPTMEVLSTDFKKLQAWIEDDREIDHPDDDRFGHAAVADRIVSYLARDESQRTTLALIGPRGSGKSTILRLVMHRLRERGPAKVRIVPISLWPYETPKAALAGMLKALTDELSRHVNTLELTGLSARYLGAVERAQGWIGGLARLLGGTEEPERVLERLSGVAGAVGVHLVLWVEDLDRFSGADHRSSSAEPDFRDHERLSAVRAMLYLLDRAPSISVVISDTTLQTRFDLEKIARYIEYTPRLNPADVWKCIETFRKGCLGGWPREVIDPLDADLRAKHLALDMFKEDINVKMQIYRQHCTTGDAMIIALSTPRVVKCVMRSVHLTWSRIPGEIDFDDLLAVSVIREQFPELFALIDQYTDGFRFGFTSAWQAAHPDAGHPVHIAVNQIIASLNPHTMQVSAQRLLDYLFPKYKDHSIQINMRARPQRVCHAEPRDYWRRAVAAPGIAPSESDQAVLRSIRDWKRGESDAATGAVSLLDRLFMIEDSRVVVPLSGQLTEGDVLGLIGPVCQRYRGLSEQEWDAISGGSARASGRAGLWTIRHLLNESREIHARPQSVMHIALREILAAISDNLPLAAEIYYTLVLDSGVIDDTQHTQVCSNILNKLVEVYSERQGRDLIKSMRFWDPYAIYHMVWGLRRIRANDMDCLPGEKWAEFAPVLLDSAARDPSRGVPILVPFITSTREELPESDRDRASAVEYSNWNAVFRADRAERLFSDRYVSDRYGDLLRILATSQPPESPAAPWFQMWVQWRAAHEGAKEALRELER